MRLPIDIAHRLRRRLMALAGWRTRGVKVMAFDPTRRLLLVRHRYGRSDLWMLPGGGIGRGEQPAAAAIRELAEETGCALSEITPVGTWETRAEGRRDTVYLFRGTTADTPRIDAIELAEACFFAIDALPAATSPATRRRVDEWLGARAPDGVW